MKIFQALLAIAAITSVSGRRGKKGKKGRRGSSSDSSSSSSSDSSSSDSSSSDSNDTHMENISAFAIASGAQEVPAVNSDTSAQLALYVRDDLSSIDFLLEVENGVDINQAHLHCAFAGANGAVLAFLFPLNAGGVNVDGTLSQGTLTNANLLDVECDGVIVSNISTLVEFILQRRIYLNVHSLTNPGGEVRGQVFMS